MAGPSKLDATFHLEGRSWDDLRRQTRSNSSLACMVEELPQLLGIPMVPFCPFCDPGFPFNTAKQEQTWYPDGNRITGSPRLCIICRCIHIYIYI